jgi:hypothetical protein
LTLGFLVGIGFDELDATRGFRSSDGIQHQAKGLNPIVSINDKNPMDYSFKIIKMSTEAKLTSSIKKNDLGYELEIIGLISYSEEQAAFKEMLGIPQNQLGDVKIRVLKE